MSYNIEKMRELFGKKGALIPEQEARATAAATVIRDVAPHLLGIVEASDRAADHETFVAHPELVALNFSIARGTEKRGRQDLVCYYREPFQLQSVDAHAAFYDDWVEDIDGDSIDEVLHYDRKPLELEFTLQGSGIRLLLILVAFKSKGVFSVADIHRYEHLALANRKKLYAQSKKLRERLDLLLDEDPLRPIIVMGDLNDEPGYDHFERQLGFSAMETLMGSLFRPAYVLHNALWHLSAVNQGRDLWTAEYPDPIVANVRQHRAWLDHIFVSPGMLQPDAPVRYVPNSGAIGERNETAARASDHFPVLCQIEAGN